MPLILSNIPSLEVQFEAAWNEYLDWSTSEPDRSKVLHQLSTSSRIAPEAHAQVEAMFP